MSGLTSTARQLETTTTIALSTHNRHRHVPSPVSPHFSAPPVVRRLSFGPLALAAGIARTATTWDAAPADLLEGLQRSALIEFQTLVEINDTFALKSYFQLLADTQRSQFAAKVGAGVTDLYMNALGYTWRANAVCLSSILDPHADFIYAGGNATGHGVVLAEAHGSFAQSTTRHGISQQAKRKYLRQVKPHIASISPFGKVIHGYSVAFGSAPDKPGSFLSLSETKITKPRGKRSPGPPPFGERRLEDVPTPVALATHRSNFLLMGATEVVDWIDAIRGIDGTAHESQPVEFLRFQYAGSGYLTPILRPWSSDFPPWEDDFAERWRRAPFPTYLLPRSRNVHLGWFVIEENAGIKFLNALTGIIGGDRRATLQLPTFEQIGFGAVEDDDLAGWSGFGEYRYAMFRDGLALLGDPFRGRPRDIIVWSPKEGLSS